MKSDTDARPIMIMIMIMKFLFPCYKFRCYSRSRIYYKYNNRGKWGPKTVAHPCRLLAIYYLPVIELTVSKFRRQGQGELWRGLPLKMRNRLLQEPRAWSASFAIFFFCRVKFKLLHIQQDHLRWLQHRSSNNHLITIDVFRSMII